LWRADDLAALERQVLGSEDAGLLTWWARACEANNNFAQAISCYQKAGTKGPLPRNSLVQLLHVMPMLLTRIKLARLSTGVPMSSIHFGQLQVVLGATCPRWICVFVIMGQLS
jgi:hypothetical protein